MQEQEGTYAVEPLHLVHHDKAETLFRRVSRVRRGQQRAQHVGRLGGAEGSDPLCASSAEERPLKKSF